MRDECASSLKYFWRDKGDLERWVGWEEFRRNAAGDPQRQAIVDAWDRHKAAERTLDVLIDEC